MTPRRLFTLPWRSRAHIATDVDREIAFHVQSRVAELVAAGVSREDAERRALREFGDVEDAREYLIHLDRGIENTQRRREHMRDLWRDVRYAFRRMRAAPVFTATAIATLALGIGANTAVFSVVEAALLRPLPYPNADRVVVAYTVASFGNFATSPPDFFDWKSQTRSFDEMSAISAYPRTVTGRGEPQSIAGANVTHGFFQTFGVTPVVGRVFTADEEHYGNTQYVVIGYDLWQRMFGGRDDVVGQSLEINAKRYLVVGVMPKQFSYPGRTQFWMPLAFSAHDLETQRGAHYLDVVALLKRGVAASAASEDLGGVMQRLAATYPNTDKEYIATVAPLRDALVGGTPKRALMVLLLAVALVALIASANVANLVLARGTSRRREMAVRLALGATPRDLAYIALTENVVLALLGGLAGLLLATVLSGALDALRPGALRDVGDLHISAMTAAFTLAVSMLVGLLCGLAPALHAARRTSLQPALQAGGRADTGERRTNALRATLVACEIALSLVLLSGAGLLTKSFARLQHVDAGFDAENLLVYTVSLPEARYATGERIAATFSDIVQRAGAAPGVKSVGLMSMLPLDGGFFSISTHSIDGAVFPPDNQPGTQIRILAPGTLGTLGIRLVRGRDVAEYDRLGSQRVVLVNEAAARRLWKEVDPIGHTISISTRFGDDTSRAAGTVVGIVSDIRDRALGSPPSATVYFPHAQAPWSDMNVVVRPAAGIAAASLTSTLRAQLHAVDPLLPMVDARTMDDVVRGSVAQPRFATLLMGIFAALAVVLALIGVFGVMAYMVGQRSREIGIRIALGASGGRVVRETLERAAIPVFAGVLAGVLVTFVSVRALTRLLYDVQPHDPLVIGGLTLALVAVALLAAYLPARRASSVDPLTALRAD
ncbi:MAG TPA: ABC transporter permease [Gemmatimonadaceae bacterium]|nr:ABC transporter permease [Gemmatimonadaceae bacterium]